MNPKFILIQPIDKSLFPVCYEVKEVLWETEKAITLAVKAKGSVTVRKKKAKGILFNHRPYGWGDPWE